MKQVTIYSSNSCGYCTMAKRLLQQKGVAPVDIGVDGDQSLRMELMERTGRRTVPQIFIGEQHIGGFDDLATLERTGKLEAMLHAA